ncbi:hypothetical protein [Chitinimonas lacunae]|uniref:Uncharacterized protein n=1 Tax=Chitinimonas lacunae TaxID=1963018 RepID=A0ABV8MMS1_9NEIS
MPVPNSWLRRRGKRTVDTSQSRNDNAPGATPKLPHEHDESPEFTQDQPRKVIKQALDDVERGVEDTDRRSAYGLGEDEGLNQRKTNEGVE